MWDAHVMEMGWAVCSSSSSWSLRQDVTSEMKFTDAQDMASQVIFRDTSCHFKTYTSMLDILDRRYMLVTNDGIHVWLFVGWRVGAVQSVRVSVRHRSLSSPSGSCHRRPELLGSASQGRAQIYSTSKRRRACQQPRRRVLVRRWFHARMDEN